MGCIYGYCRVSSKKQNIERQVRNILAVHPTAIIVKEVFTRTSFCGRKEWDKIMRVIKPGDMIVFDSVSRMCGNADEPLQRCHERSQETLWEEKNSQACVDD